MKQYKFTSASFVQQSAPTAPDAYIDPEVLGAYQRGEEPTAKTKFEAGHLPNLGKYQADNNIKPGTDKWFKLWFSQPGVTGESPYEKN